MGNAILNYSTILMSQLYKCIIKASIKTYLNKWAKKVQQMPTIEKNVKNRVFHKTYKYFFQKIGPKCI